MYILVTFPTFHPIVEIYFVVLYYIYFSLIIIKNNLDFFGISFTNN